MEVLWKLKGGPETVALKIDGISYKCTPPSEKLASDGASMHQFQWCNRQNLKIWINFREYVCTKAEDKTKISEEEEMPIFILPIVNIPVNIPKMPGFLMPNFLMLMLTYEKGQK